MVDTSIHFPDVRDISALFTWSEEHFGYDEEKVRSVMLYYNIVGYNPTKWWTCTGLIRHYHEEEQQRLLLPHECPICKAEILRDFLMDGLFGVRYGWRCTKDNRHFMLARINELRKLFEERKKDDGRTKQEDGTDNVQS